MQLQPDVVFTRPPDQSAGDYLSRFSNVVAFLQMSVAFALNELPGNCVSMQLFTKYFSASTVSQ